MPRSIQHTLQREIMDTLDPLSQKCISGHIFRCVCKQGESRESWREIQTPADLMLPHSPQLSFPQHLDTVKHLADPDKIQQAFAAGFGRKPQWIPAHLKAVRSELELVRGDASCNLRLPFMRLASCLKKEHPQVKVVSCCSHL